MSTVWLRGTVNTSCGTHMETQTSQYNKRSYFQEGLRQNIWIKELALCCWFLQPSCTELVAPVTHWVLWKKKGKKKQRKKWQKKGKRLKKKHNKVNERWMILLRMHSPLSLFIDIKYSGCWFSVSPKKKSSVRFTSDMYVCAAHAVTRWGRKHWSELMVVLNTMSAAIAEGKSEPGWPAVSLGNRIPVTTVGNRFFFFPLTSKLFWANVWEQKEWNERQGQWESAIHLAWRCARWDHSQCWGLTQTRNRTDALQTHYKAFGKTNVCVHLVLLCRVEKSWGCQIS